MKIFLINLDRNPERLSFMKKQLDHLGLAFERVPGVDGVALSDSDLQGIYDESTARRENSAPLTRGYIGGALSHIKIYERMIEEDIPYSLVLEDDVVLSKELTQVLDERWVGEGNWDYVNLIYTPMSSLWMKSWLEASGKRIKKNPLFILYALLKIPYMMFLFIFEIFRQKLFCKNNPRPVCFFRPLYHTGAYLISRGGAKKLVDFAYPIRFASDRLPNQARIQAGLKMRGYCPPPVRNSGRFGSDTV